jgi:LysR family tcuABC transcriptional regulator
MDARQLKYFVQIVESGSLTKASRQLFVAQPALSAQMARLEGEVGKPLLVRSVRGVVPTENGLALYQHAKFVLRQLDEAVFVARQEYSSVQGRVTLGLTATTTCVLGLPLLKHIRQSNPGIVLNVIAALPAYLEDMARSDRLDVAMLNNHTAASDLTCEAMVEEELFVLLAADSKLVAADRTSLTLAELARLPLALPSPAHGVHRMLMAEFARARLDVQPVAELDSLLLTVRYVLDGGGVTLQPMAATLTFDDPKALRCLSISDARLAWTQYLYALPVQKMSTAAVIVHSELKRVLRELVDTGIWKGVRLLGGGEHAAPEGAPSSAGMGSIAKQ